MNIAFNQYSFVQDGSLAYNKCYNELDFCLPITSMCNLKFQAEITNLPSGTFGVDYGITFLPIKNTYTLNPAWLQNYIECMITANGGIYNSNNLPFGLDAVHISGDLYEFSFNNYCTIDNYITLYKKAYIGEPTCNQYANENILSINDCVRFVAFVVYKNGSTANDVIPPIYFDGLLNTYQYTNCFKLIIPNCDVLRLQYSNNNNGFCFKNNTTRSIELYARLDFPTFKSTISQYTQSDGVIRVVNSKFNREWRLFVNAVPQYIHDKINVALLHSSVNIKSDYITQFTGGISNTKPVTLTGDYKPSIKKDSCFASYTAEATLTETNNLCTIMNNC